MTQHEETRILPYLPEQVFKMVADIERYPEFLPWCQAARFRNRKFEDNIEIVDADLIISFLAFREKFGSRVAIDSTAQVIEVNYLDGPFKTLKNHWKFHPVDEGVKVDFFVEFEFKSRILEGVIGKVFDQAMRRIISAFETRADELYG